MSNIKGVKSGSWSKAIFYAPLLAGLIFILILILHFGANMALQDQWEMVPLFQKAAHHNLGLSDLWHQHNEHRILFPLLAALASAYMTHWNTVAETLLGLAFATVTASLLFVMLRKSLKQASVGVVAAVLFSAWFFSPIQWENWLWGWQLEWFMCVAATITMIFLLIKALDVKNEKSSNILCMLAALSAIIANYSLADGILAWAVGLFILAVGKQTRKVVFAWVSLGAVANLLYYYHYKSVPTPSGSATTVFIHSPVAFAKFFLAFLGDPVGSVDTGMQTPYIIGSLLLLGLLPLLYITWQRRQNIRIYLPWLSVILLAVLAGLSTAFGRLGYGITFALNSRYNAFSLLFIIGFIGLAFTLIVSAKGISRNAQKIYTSTIALLCIPLLVSSYSVGFQGFKRQSHSLAVAYTCTHLPVVTDDCLRATYPSAQIVRPRFEYVKAKHWAGY
jgi:MFS family permease